jgi:hypothetical protein
MKFYKISMGHTLLSYLGLPITLGRLRLVHLQFVFDKAATKLNGWQGKLLNLGGCRELVK